jgi:hypothetical protein
LWRAAQTVFAVVDFIGAAAVFAVDMAAPVKLGSTCVVFWASVVPTAIALVKLAVVSAVVMPLAMAISAAIAPLVLVLPTTIVGERQAAGQQSGSGKCTHRG